MGLGMPEVILILVIALIVFGPRKLPELGKSLGQAMTQFRRASDDFKRTWEQEVETEKYRKGDTASSSSSHDYSSSSSDGGDGSYGDSYNPYGSDTDAHQASSSADVKHNESSGTDSPAKPDAAKTEVAASAAAGESKQKHWI
jgi:TatA/E family protein of Tat protein translocase